jgi:hypothetical protein
MYRVVARSSGLLAKELCPGERTEYGKWEGRYLGNNGRNEMEWRKIGWNSVTKGIRVAVANARVGVANGGLVCRVTWCLYDYSIDGGMWWRQWYELTQPSLPLIVPYGQHCSVTNLLPQLDVSLIIPDAQHCLVPLSSLSLGIKCAWKTHFLCFSPIRKKAANCSLWGVWIPVFIEDVILK